MYDSTYVEPRDMEEQAKLGNREEVQKQINEKKRMDKDTEKKAILLALNHLEVLNLNFH